MAIAVAIVYLVMVATFRSLIQPLILLVSIPFAATGAVGLLLITDTALGVASMIGLLMLIGIVVTNAIVLIDLVNQFREQDHDVDDARSTVPGCAAADHHDGSGHDHALVPMALGITGVACSSPSRWRSW